MTSVVTPWRTFGSWRGSARIARPPWLWRSIKPGATTWPRASTRPGPRAHSESLRVGGRAAQHAGASRRGWPRRPETPAPRSRRRPSRPRSGCRTTSVMANQYASRRLDPPSRPDRRLPIPWSPRPAPGTRQPANEAVRPAEAARGALSPATQLLQAERVAHRESGPEAKPPRPSLVGAPGARPSQYRGSVNRSGDADAHPSLGRRGRRTAPAGGPGVGCARDARQSPGERVAP